MSVNEAIPIHSLVTIDILVIKILPVGLNVKVTVKINVSVRIPINTMALVSFPDSIAVSGNTPVSISIQVDIPVSETDLAPCNTKLASGLRNLIKIHNQNPTLKKILTQ
ncbi:MAG: hypothetical protein WBN28_09195 [Lutimonas sp.]